MTADTFEALAILYRTGARRTPPVAPSKTATIVSDMPIIDHGAASVAPTAEPASEDWTKPKIFSGKTKSNTDTII
ncbi:MAG: hypothetical protein HGB05_01560 [Chloroflexi bacterium]|nr:hypothetical protein [Chloroflexota bacterium]